jgi:hypothetical protein
MRILAFAVTALSICTAGLALAQDTQPAPAKEPSAPPAETAAPPASAAPSITLPEAPPTAQADGKPPAPSVIGKDAKLADRAPAALSNSSPHFGFQRVDGGFLRFDYRTGKVAYCAPRGETWGCEAVPEERAALEKEVEQLRGEVADLKHEVESLREPPPPRPPQPVPPSPSKNNGDMTDDLPGRDQVAQATAVLQDYWHQFVALIVGFKNDLLRKS